MKRYFLTFFAATCVLASLFAFVAPASAQYTNELGRQLGATAGESGAGFERPADPRAVAARVIKVALGFLGIIILGYTIYGGYMIMTSAGNTDQVETGKKTIRNGVIGLIVVTSAYSITTFAVRFATGDALRQGDFIEIEDDPYPNQDPLNQGITPDAFSPIDRNQDGTRVYQF